MNLIELIEVFYLNLNKFKQKSVKFIEQDLLSDEVDITNLIALLDESSSDDVPLVLSMSKNNVLWIYSVIVENELLKKDHVDKLLNWSISYSIYGYGCNSDNEIFLSSPHESSKPDILNGALPIFFVRNIFNGTATEIDLNQQITHRLDLAWYNKKNSFCKLDQNGDYCPAAYIIENNEIRLCTLDRDEINNYLAISDSTLIRFFVYYNKSITISTENNVETTKLSDKNIFYKNIKGFNKGNLVLNEIRGFQLIKTNKFAKEVYNDDWSDNNKEYQDFIIYDFKNEKILEHNSSPDNLSNYFVKSDLPFETSFAFFRTEVLNRFKLDSEKYLISNRQIECRGTWNLRYSMSDDESQVIVYIIDLSNLPENEQIYWKSFNVKPNSKLSYDVFTNDFLGEWTDNIDSLIALKLLLRNFPSCEINGNKVEIWQEKNKNNTRVLDYVQYVQTGTKDEWEKEIARLHQNLVDCLSNDALDKIANELGCYNQEFIESGSINKLKTCLNTIDFEKTDEIIQPLKDLNSYRISINHPRSSFTYPDDLKKDFYEIVTKCFESYKLLAELISDGKFNFNRYEMLQ